MCGVELCRAAVAVCLRCVGLAHCAVLGGVNSALSVPGAWGGLSQ